MESLVVCADHATFTFILYSMKNIYSLKHDLSIAGRISVMPAVVICLDTMCSIDLPNNVNCVCSTCNPELINHLFDGITSSRFTAVCSFRVPA